MNIFKILANGDGTIKEPNISAFLGYLLDPYQDHGLGFEFLERFLGRVFEKQEEKFNIRSYDYEILFEQAFKDDDKKIKKKEIVDIVILCFESNKGTYKELIAENAITKTRILKYIFLIENKVSKGTEMKQQLKAQYDNTIKKLKLDTSKVISLYVTPDEEGFKGVFKNFVETDLKEHYIWKNKDVDNKNDLLNLLLELISDNSLGRIEAINEYTKHTLISFIQFIENDFKAQIIEKIDNATGKYKKNIYNNIEDYSSRYADNLNDISNSLLMEFNNYLKHEHANLFVIYNKTSPIVVQKNPKSGKIFACHKNGKNLYYHFVINNKSNPGAVAKLKSYLDAKGFKYFEDWAIIVKENFDFESLKELFNNYLEILLINKS